MKAFHPHGRLIALFASAAFSVSVIVAAHLSPVRAQEVLDDEVLDATAPAAQNPVSAARAEKVLLAPEALLESSEIFGRSVRGRPLWAHVLGDGPEVTLIFAAVHGNETATPYLVQQLRAHLKRHPGLLKNKRVVLIPVLNPDGLQR